MSFLIIFLLMAPAIVLYSQGYRIDIENKKITQTGGLFLKILPKQVEVYLDGKLSKKTDFFFGSVLVENLLPQKYKIEVKKEGFYLWEKTLEIKEKQVTEAKNIILFPEDPEFTALFTGVENFWFSSDQKKIVLRENNQNIWSLKLYEIEKKVKTHLIDETNISGRGADLISLEFSPDAKKISLEAGVAEQLRYYEIDLDKTPVVLTRKEAPPLPSENTLALLKLGGGNEVYYLDAFGYLYKTDSSFETKEKINEIPFPITLETEYKIRKIGNLFFLQKEKSIYKLNPASKSFEMFFDGINDLNLSPDSKKLVYFSDYEIWLLFLEDDLPLYQAGDKIFLIRLSEKIKDCLWLNSNYLVFTAGDKIKISEIDNRDRINIVDIKQTKNPDVFWSKIEKKLYLLDTKTLYLSEALLF